MPRSDMIEMKATVTEAMCGGKFKVKLDDMDKEMVATPSGKLRSNMIKIVVGDKVTVEISPYSVDQCRIIWRNR